IYSRAILKGEAKPHRTTRFVLLLDTCLSTAALFAQHDTVAIWLSGVSALQAVFIFALCIKHGMGGWAKIDLLCLAIALAGIVLWQTTDNPSLALYASIFSDFVGMMPALIKTYYHPETEIVSFFAIDVVAAIFSTLALKSWNIQQSAYPIYIMIINALMVILIIRPRLQKMFQK
ncbi:MAG TPA: hypothetical protein VLE91_04695, partial [Candidatus Saccharimonadales bacterium]|nr:hypothetical protein [Candidatus Saccharimonadales bacterium]